MNPAFIFWIHNNLKRKFDDTFKLYKLNNFYISNINLG